MRSTLILTLALCLSPGERPSPVRLIETAAGGRCSAVVLSRTRALTAAHCLPLPEGVHTRVIAADVAEITGEFAPPYARLGVPHDGQRILLEGYGCEPKRVWVFAVPTRHVRGGRVLAVLPAPGLELAISGTVCHGDSGGAVWADGGNLVGLITATAVGYPNLSFGTLIP